MILFPAIDLKDGQCVRLRQGEIAEATVFNTDPAAQARDFEDQGFEFLHIVDLPVDRIVADDQRFDQEQVCAEYDDRQQEERRQSADPGSREHGFTCPARPPRP